MTFKDELLLDRYLCFLKYRKQSPFFDEELHAHIILDFKQAVEFLKLPEMSSNRKKYQFSTIQDCPYSKSIAQFYSQWLMYMEGHQHEEYRKLISQSISNTYPYLEEVVTNSFNKYVIPNLLVNADEIEIISKITHPFVIYTLSYFFGINESDYENIISVSKPIVKLISSGSIGSKEEHLKVLSSIMNTDDILTQCILSCNKKNSVIGFLLANDIPLDTIRPLLINILIDGYDPLISAINQYLLYISKKTIFPEGISKTELFDEIIRLEPAFQYCARLATDDVYLGEYLIKRGDRVIAFISAANRDKNIFFDEDKVAKRSKKNKHLSFGYGKHRCIGALLAQKIVVSFITKIEDLIKNSGTEFIYHRDIWTNSIGFRALQELYIGVKNEK